MNNLGFIKILNTYHNKNINEEVPNVVNKLSKKTLNHLVIWAATAGKLFVLKYLRDNNVSMLNPYALEMACDNGHLNVVQYLHDCGAEHQNNAYLKQCAEFNERFNVVEYLESIT